MSNTTDTKFEWTDELVKEFADNVPVDEMSNDTHIQHFKASKQPKQERIEVLISGDGTTGQYTFIIPLKREHFIHPDKFPAIKQAIESVLNNDTVVEDSGAEKSRQNMKAYSNGYQMGYKTAMKYAPEQPTNDNAFVWDESLVGELTEWASSNDWTYLPSKNKWFNEEDEINITPITTEQLINKFKQSKQSVPPIVKDKEVIVTDNSDVACLSLNDVWECIKESGCEYRVSTEKLQQKVKQKLSK